MSPMMTIAKREFRSYFDSPLAYVVICLTFFLLGLAIFMVGGFWKIDRASLHQLFQYMPLGLAVLIVPVVTMRLIAEEKSKGSFELLASCPIGDWSILLGKYFALVTVGLVIAAISALLTATPTS